MIKLHEAEIINSLPPIIANQTWAKAVNYATVNMFKRILECADASRTFSRVDKLDNKVLDVLAVDLRVSNYDQSYPIEIKRKLVKLALQYWSAAGTKAATEGVVKTILGDATISEWFEYDGKPGYFKILITDTTLTDKDVLEFQRVVENVKRLSAWLDKIVLELETEPLKVNVGFIENSFIAETVTQQRDGNEFLGFFIQEGALEKYTVEEGA